MSLFSVFKEKPLRKALEGVPLPAATGLTVADALQDLRLEKGKLYLKLCLGYPFAAVESELSSRIHKAVEGKCDSVELSMQWQVADTQSLSSHPAVPGVKNIIAVASGKGGVGKSTTTANLALALSAAGAKVGVLDADIYGPSQSKMLGVEGVKPEIIDGKKVMPIEAAGGIQMIGMGNLVDENTPMVWRGPMVSGAFKQLLSATAWSDIDYLLIDMPPGTGDIQLTLSQSVPVSGAVIVTTPQDIALLDARKGIEMFRKVNVPILGVVENMSLHTCSNCGHEDAVFGTSGGERLAKDYDVEMLGQLPLQASICEQTDRGEPPVLANPGSPVSKKYADIAARVAGGLWSQALKGATGPSISISDD